MLTKPYGHVVNPYYDYMFCNQSSNKKINLFLQTTLISNKLAYKIAKDNVKKGKIEVKVKEDPAYIIKITNKNQDIHRCASYYTEVN